MSLVQFFKINVSKAHLHVPNWTKILCSFVYSINSREMNFLPASIFLEWYKLQISQISWQSATYSLDILVSPSPFFQSPAPFNLLIQKSSFPPIIPVYSLLFKNIYKSLSSSCTFFHLFEEKKIIILKITLNIRKVFGIVLMSLNTINANTQK